MDFADNKFVTYNQAKHNENVGKNIIAWVENARA